MNDKISLWSYLVDPIVIFNFILVINQGFS